MSILDGGSVTAADDGGTPPNLDLEYNYGVTVRDVRELAAHVFPNPIMADPHFGADAMEPTITDIMVARWINRVADTVRARTAVLSHYTDNPGRWAAIIGSARTAVLNGAAYYLVAAAYPTRAGTNESTSAAGDLRSRYMDEMAYISETLPKLFIDQDAGGVVDEDGTKGIAPLVSQSPSNIPMSLFHHRPYMDPYGYPPAPGAEYPYR